MAFYRLPLLLPCCHPQALTFSQVVPSTTGAFWTLQTTSVKQKVAHGYKFYRDGRCVYYLLSKEGAWRRYGWGDDERTNTWLVRRDTLSVNGVTTKILAVKQDTVYLYEIGTRDTLLLVRAK